MTDWLAVHMYGDVHKTCSGPWVLSYRPWDSVQLNVFTVVLGTLNTFDGTDPKVDRVKPKVQNFFPLWLGFVYNSRTVTKNVLCRENMPIRSSYFSLIIEGFGDLEVTVRLRRHIPPHPQ